MDLTNGNRTNVSVSDLGEHGSLTLPSVTDATPSVWTVPGNTILVVDWNDALHLFDPASKMSNLLSY